LHAVVADAMPRGAHRRVVDHDHRERADRPGFALQLLGLGEPLLERAAGELNAEGALLEMDLPARVRLLLQALRARVLALLVAPDAVVGLVARTVRIPSLH